MDFFVGKNLEDKKKKWRKELSERKVIDYLLKARSGSPFSLYRRKNHLVIRNVSWGFLDNEADVLAVDFNMRLLECEIKISISDFRREFKKEKYKNVILNNSKLYQKFFIIPEYIYRKNIFEITEKAIAHSFGILTLSDFGYFIFCVRPAPILSQYVITREEFNVLARLVCFRQCL